MAGEKKGLCQASRYADTSVVASPDVEYVVSANGGDFGKKKSRSTRSRRGEDGESSRGRQAVL